MTVARRPVHIWRESLLSLRFLGCLPLKDEVTGSGGRRPRNLGGGNRGPGCSTAGNPPISAIRFGDYAP
jgi:hypothetical protein